MIISKFKSTLRTIALAGAAAMTIGTVFTQKADASSCKNYSWGIGCHEVVNQTVDRVGFKWNDGDWLVAEITCLSGRWILHGGWKGTVSKSIASEVAKGYCAGRGPMI